MRLTINLATRRYINMRRLNGLLIACFLLLTGLLVYETRQIAGNKADIDRIRRQSAAALSGPAGAPAVSRAQIQELSGKIAFANGLIEKKTVNWVGLLDKLEEVVPPGVSLTQVEPVLRDQAVRLNGVARNFANLRALLENMEQSDNFSEVYLLSQNEQKVGATQQGIGFNLTCKVGYR